jgi:hypothetical protein
MFCAEAAAAYRRRFEEGSECAGSRLQRQRGVTAQFNLKFAARINREIGADFDLDQWRHRAIYNSLKPAGSRCIFISETDQFVHSTNEVPFPAR